MSNGYTTQNQLLLDNLLKYYRNNDYELMEKIIPIINGQSDISIRIIDWFVTNYAKKNFVIYNVEKGDSIRRFKVYMDYKLKLKSYSKKRFDPFCRWQRINIPYKNNTLIQTTLGQLNFFKWALENQIIEYISTHMDAIEKDMNNCNSTSKRKQEKGKGKTDNTKTRKKREELSISAVRSIKKENVEIVVKFD